MAVNEEAEAYRLEGNNCFNASKFKEAIDLYSKAIDINPTPNLLCNRSLAYIKVELPGAAISDAEEAIKLEPGFAKAYYRKASAHLLLGKFKEALAAFDIVVKLVPGDADAKKMRENCDKKLRQIRFEKAIKAKELTPISETIKLGSIAVNYVGPTIPEGGITAEFVSEMREHFRLEKKIDRRDAVYILLEVLKLLKQYPNVVNVKVPDSSRINVCGDTHGQYYDTLHIFNECGDPSPLNWYLFNGDFVDRGSYSVENALLLFAYKLLLPNCFFISRGNHEGVVMNRVYGFEGEVQAKYSNEVFDLFIEVFSALPIAHIINDEVFVVHGGIPTEENINIEDIQKQNRFAEIPESGLICECLWADPQPMPGKGPSKRGTACFSFGPDITANFLKRNNLKLLIRSHEVKQNGYEVEHDGKCITVFSAPNYCDRMGNMGAVIQLSGDDMNPKYVVYKESTHPGKSVMYYTGRPFNF